MKVEMSQDFFCRIFVFGTPRRQRIPYLGPRDGPKMHGFGGICVYKHKRLLSTLQSTLCITGRKWKKMIDDSLLEARGRRYISKKE